jgi:aryl-alcohol dehydrogenase-like predicted oxidoreductase
VREPQAPDVDDGVARPWLRSLPNGKAISALGFGCSSVWAKPSYPDETARALLDVLFAEGVNHFDTAPSYGHGTGERRLGRWLAGKPHDRLVVSTKVGTNLLDGRIERAFTRDRIERSLDGSLARLGVDRVDIVYLHGPGPDDLSTPVLDFLDRLKADGRISYSGVNSFDNRVLMRTAQSPIDVVMLQYNVGDFRNRESMRTLHAAGKVVISGTALARARFAPFSFVPTTRVRLWYLLRMIRHEPLFAFSGLKLSRRLAATGRPPAQAAIQFLTGDPMVLSSLFGTSSVEHARENARAGRGRLPGRARARLAEQG